MRYIDQSPLVDLRVTFADPPGKALLIQSRLPLQGRADRVNNEVQEVRFIATITVWTGEDNPIGSAGFYAAWRRRIGPDRKSDGRCGCPRRACRQ